MAGTLAYMAPEAARGEAVDRRADLFSFVLTLRQMLPGQLPFAAPDATRLLRAIQREEPARTLRPASGAAGRL